MGVCFFHFFFRVPPKATPKSFVYPQLLKAQVRYAVEPRGILRSRFSSTAQSFGCSWTGRSTATEFGVRKLWVPPSDLKEEVGWVSPSSDMHQE